MCTDDRGLIVCIQLVELYNITGTAALTKAVRAVIVTVFNGFYFCVHYKLKRGVEIAYGGE